MKRAVAAAVLLGLLGAFAAGPAAAQTYTPTEPYIPPSAEWVPNPVPGQITLSSGVFPQAEYNEVTEEWECDPIGPYTTYVYERTAGWGPFRRTTRYCLTAGQAYALDPEAAAAAGIPRPNTSVDETPDITSPVAAGGGESQRTEAQVESIALGAWPLYEHTLMAAGAEHADSMNNGVNPSFVDRRTVVQSAGMSPSSPPGRYNVRAAWSIEMEVKVPNPLVEGYIWSDFSDQDGVKQGARLYVYEGINKLDLLVGNGGGFTQCSPGNNSLTAGETAFLAVVINNGTSTIYKNGVSVASCSTGTLTVAGDAHGQSLNIGNKSLGWGAGGNAASMMHMADVAIYEHALTAGQVLTHYEADPDSAATTIPDGARELEVTTETTVAPAADDTSVSITPQGCSDGSESIWCLGTRVKGFFENLGNRFKSGINNMRDILRNTLLYMLQGLKTALAEGFDLVRDKLQDLYNGLGGLLTSILTAVNTMTHTLWQTLQDGFDGLQWTLGWVNGWLQQVKNAVVDIGVNIVGAIADLPELVLNLLIGGDPTITLTAPSVNCATTFPCNWIDAIGDGVGEVGNEVDTGLDGSVCGPRIGWDDFGVRLPAPASSGCLGNGPEGARLAADDTAGDLLGYRTLVRTVLSLFLWLGFAVQLVRLAPWSRSAPEPSIAAA